MNQDLDEARGECSKLKRDNIELRNHIITLEQLLCVKEDVHSQLISSNDRLSQKTEALDSLKAQLDGSAKVTEALENKNYELEKCLIYLKNVISEKDQYTNNLKCLILELKEKSQLYVPVNDDSIDRRVADFINSSNDPRSLTKLFLREGEGVYQFGSKRVFVKLENEKAFIRVGGGFLSLEDFIRQFAPLELEKMAQNDPQLVLAKNIAINKVIAGRSVTETDKSKISPLTYKNALNFSKDN
jgi:vacuolar-type H+-ATPase subunit I/STV1